ncbi:MAG: 50S ribosomal protein L11 methyltransferase [Bacteroidales bacterium]|nr:50S ribosomal protein L11 methyltransferase [Bacteroidales bacterium]
MDYCEFNCSLDCLADEKKELLTAFLAECGFESFFEENEIYKAYIQDENFDADALCETIEAAEPLFGTINYAIKKIPSQNWNSEWESTFESVKINDQIIVRTPNYHPTESFKHEIVIDPKMSFGSGTHETTSQILQFMSQVDFKGKTVADCGCGTGILGIFAEKLGAKSVFAFDYDSCCVENTHTNLALNSCKNTTVELGKLDLLQNKEFDIVIANINRNILIENMSFIANSVKSEGILIMSGFYQEDVAEIQKNAEAFNFKLIQTESKNNWTITTFKR